MKVLVIILAVLVVVVLALLLVVLSKGVRRAIQRFVGLEHQRDSAKASRVEGAEHLKRAERSLIETQGIVGVSSDRSHLRALERERLRITTLADQFRHATYGYTEIGAANPVRESELAQLQLQDANLSAETSRVAALAEDIRKAALAGEPLSFDSLVATLDLVEVALEQRKAAN